MSPSERIARERLSLRRQQVLEGAKEDSRLARKAKSQRRANFRQQVEPRYAELERDEGIYVRQTGGFRVFGRSRGRSSGRGNNVVDRRGAPPMTAAPGATRPTPTTTRVRGFSEASRIKSPRKRWTTEGYRGTGRTGSEVERARQVVEKVTSKGRPEIFSWVRPDQVSRRTQTRNPYSKLVANAAVRSTPGVIPLPASKGQR